MIIFNWTQKEHGLNGTDLIGSTYITAYKNTQKWYLHII